MKHEVHVILHLPPAVQRIADLLAVALEEFIGVSAMNPNLDDLLARVTNQTGVVASAGLAFAGLSAHLKAALADAAANDPATLKDKIQQAITLIDSNTSTLAQAIASNPDTTGTGTDTTPAGTGGDTTGGGAGTDTTPGGTGTDTTPAGTGGDTTGSGGAADQTTPPDAAADASPTTPG